MEQLLRRHIYCRNEILRISVPHSSSGFLFLRYICGNVTQLDFGLYNSLPDDSFLRIILACIFTRIRK